jgi:hypothetical protein
MPSNIPINQSTATSQHQQQQQQQATRINQNQQKNRPEVTLFAFFFGCRFSRPPHARTYGVFFIRCPLTSRGQCNAIAVQKSILNRK